MNNSISKPVPYVRYTQPKTNPPGFWGWADPTHAINPPNGPTGACSPPTPCGNVVGGPPTPHLITNQFQEGTYSLNYFNEPLAYRIASGTAAQTDLANVFKSMTRADGQLNIQPHKGTPISAPGGFVFPPKQVGTEDTDPYTPLLRAYEGDNIQIRNLVGAHMAPHSFHIHGLNWQFEPSVKSSGFRSTQGMGISEHYEFLFQLPVTSQAKQSDYLYIPTSDTNGLQYGNWGLIRGYKDKKNDLASLNETQKIAFPASKPIPDPASADFCPAGAPARTFNVTAVYAPVALGGPLVYNKRGLPGAPGQTQITDQSALMYVLTDDLSNGKLKPGVPREPLILRAAAGDCIKVELTNGVPNSSAPLNPGLAAVPLITDVQLQTSHQIGIHPQLLAYDVTTSDGFNIGTNQQEVTVEPGSTHEYKWYAGRLTRDATGKPVYTPVEFGAVNLAPSDPLMQDNFGLIGALIIEPQGATWQTDSNSRASATVTKADKSSFREGVVMVQDDLADLGGFQGLNYRTEPFPYRYANPNYLRETIRLFRRSAWDVRSPIPWSRPILRRPCLSPARALPCVCACCIPPVSTSRSLNFMAMPGRRNLIRKTLRGWRRITPCRRPLVRATPSARIPHSMWC